jgi:hypothetical protein
MCHHYESYDWTAIRERIEEREAEPADEAATNADAEATVPDEVATPADD